MIKLTNVRALGRYKAPGKDKPVNVYTGRRAERGTDHKFYLYRSKRQFISDAEWSQWTKVGELHDRIKV